MPLFDFNAEDVAGSVILQPGWYLLEVSRAEEKVSQAGNNMLVVYWRALEAKDSSGNPVPEASLKSVRIKPSNFVSEGKGKAFAVNFAKAMGANLTKDGGKATLTPDSVTGKRVRAFIANTIYQNKTQNEPQDYQPAG